MLENFAIGVGLLALLIVSEYCWFRQLNRRRAACILGWIARAFRGHGYVGPVRWDNSWCFHVELRLGPSIFRRASLAVRLRPCDLWGRWLHHTRRTQETVTFQAELDANPEFNLYTLKHHWQVQTTRVRPSSLAGWQLASLDPMVLSTQAEGQNQRSHVFDTLLAARSSQFLRIAFRRQPPQLVACAPLQSLSPDEPGGEIFVTLRELASSASHSAH